MADPGLMPIPRTACPPLSEFEALEAGKLAEAQADHIREHVEHCAACVLVAARVFGRERRALAAGSVLDDRYELTKIIGSGGLGTVWEARELRGGDLVAIKILNTSEPDPIRRFVQREARIGLRMQAAGFVRVRELLSLEGGRPALVMDRLFGKTLAQRMKSGEPLPVHEALAILRPLSAALVALHKLQVAHRDLTPNNIYLEQDLSDANGGAFKTIRILDLGFARSMERSRETASAKTITAKGVVFGTEGYMAPEQLFARAAGTPADIWSLGSVAYFMLTGRCYVGVMSVDGGYGGWVPKPTPDLSALTDTLPESLRQLIEGSLQANPSQRTTARAWRDALAGV